MALTYEQALETICSMFESWDRETITAVFESNGYHVERTIEAILAMEQPSGSNITSSNDRADNLLDFQDEFEEPVGRGSSVADVRNSEGFSTKHKGRGIPCELPNDFLRRPGQNDQQFLRDEQLALMLQNELFQREVAAVMGNSHPFAEEFYLQRANRDRSGGMGMNQTAGGRGRSNGQASNRAASGGVGDLTGIPDMGILKSLQEMGDGMKNQLTQLALKFNSSTGGGTHDKDDSDLQESESRPLTAVDYEEEDDEDGPLITTAARSSSGKDSSGSTVRRRTKDK